MDREEIYLTLTSVFNYLEATPNSRCFVEGEQVLNAKHLILCGMCSQKLDVEGEFTSIKLVALCLQTSALLTGKPHQISGWLNLNKDNNNWDISPFVCSCKAGASGKCKHISAMLLKCTRANILDLEKLSGTDVECYWKKHQNEIKEDYEAVPIQQTPCFQKHSVKDNNCRTLTESEVENCFQELTTIHPISALSKHLQGRRSLPVMNMEIEKAPTCDWIEPLFYNMNKSTFLPSLNVDKESHELQTCCKQFYEKLTDVDIRNIAQTCLSGTENWKIHRKYRLTGSRCYSIYTYHLSNWKKKSLSYFNAKPFSNKYVRHGIAYENEARETYKRNLGRDVIEPGFIICERYPWLGYSPDGVIYEKGKPIKLMEIKCPFIGQTVDAIEFVHECKFLNVSLDGIKLKSKHAYYGQVQLGMAILNLFECDLILYSTKSKSFINIRVPFDEPFARALIEKITFYYFTHMIHVICESK